MKFGDHRPPHFHAEYGDHEASIDIRTGEIIVGDLPARALRLVQEWWSLHREELTENWRRIETQQPLSPIEPL
jgi:hypothetical protein